MGGGGRVGVGGGSRVVVGLESVESGGRSRKMKTLITEWRWRAVMREKIQPDAGD